MRPRRGPEVRGLLRVPGLRPHVNTRKSPPHGVRMQRALYIDAGFSTKEPIEMKWTSLIVALLLLGPATLLAKGKREQPKVSMEQAQKTALKNEPADIQSKERKGEREWEGGLIL